MPSAFDNVVFPRSISFGAVGGPGYSTSVVVLSSGYESRNANWNAPRRQYDISTGIKTAAQMAEVLAFFNARQGRARGFYFYDWVEGRNVPVRFDVDNLEIEITDFAPGGFALIARKIPLIEVRV